jgi:two-component system response regulator AtoC
MQVNSKNPSSIVIVDDNLDFQRYLSQFLSARGYAVDALTSGNELLARLTAGNIPSLILLDVVMPDIDGIAVIEKISAAGIKVPVIMMSASGLIGPVVEAMKLGASDFLRKPVDEMALEAALANVCETHRSERVLPEADLDQENPGFVTTNPKLRRLAEITKRVAPTDVPILILGETGVGKEVLARYAHRHSGRGNKPFVKVNCAALPNDLLESELFGYERGAFTGATTAKPGTFERAHTGTLFLDEIGEMSPHVQAKLLHVLQDGTFTRLGGQKPIQIDARIIASTNVKIDHAIATGKFRADLYFRLSVISLDVPPLCERREDIPLLSKYFIAKYRDRYHAEARELPAQLLNSFVQHDWPGNIRELENAIKRFLVLPDHHGLWAELNPAEESTDNSTRAQAKLAAQSMSVFDVGADAADRAQQDVVRRVLKETHGNRKQAAVRLNVCYKTLLNKLKRWREKTGVPPQTIAGITIAKAKSAGNWQ